MSARRAARAACCAALLAALAAAPGARASDAGLAAAVERGDLAAAADAVTRLGQRVQGGAPPAELERIEAALATGRARLEELRRREEARAGDDEAALAALLESERWQRITYLLGVIDYWQAWALFELAEADPADTESRQRRQRERFAEAARRFGRAAITVREPAALREAGLARAVAQRRSGRPAEARRTLDHLVAGFPDAPAEWLGRVELERMRTAAALGDRAAVLRATEGARPDSPAGVERLLERLRVLLGPPRAAERDPALRETLALLLEQPGSVRARAVALLAEARLDVAEIDALGLGSLGDALAGIALYRAGDHAAAARRLGALDPNALPAGFRGDVLLLYRADALARTEQWEAAAATTELFRRRFPRSALAGQAARIAYGAAQRRAGGAGGASRELAAAADWVIAAAPDSPEAGHARARRALAASTRLPPGRALRELEAIAPGTPGHREARIQRALLLSAELQAALEAGDDAEALRTGGRRLAAALEEIEPLLRGDERRTLAGDLALARARADIAAGRTDAALAALGAAVPGAERERTRLVALARAGRHGEAADAALALLDAPGARALALRYALDAADGPVPAEAQPRLARLLEAAGERARAEGREALVLALLDREAALALEGDPARALALYERYRAAAPDSARALAGRARALAAGGRHEEALAAWDEIARRSEPGSAAWYEARVGVARALAARHPEEGCRVARSILALRDDVPPDADAALRRIAAACPDEAPGLGGTSKAVGERAVP